MNSWLVGRARKASTLREVENKGEWVFKNQKNYADVINGRPQTNISLNGFISGWVDPYGKNRGLSLA